MVNDMRKEGTKKRLTKYEINILPRIPEIKAYMREGGTEVGVAKQLGVGYSTFRKYKNEHPEFRAALLEGETPANLKVENSLFERCLGGERKVEKAMKLKTVTYENGKRVKEEERVEIVTETVFIPPDTPAIKFWLINRLPDKWRDKVDTSLSDPEGNAIRIEFGNAEEAAK